MDVGKRIKAERIAQKLTLKDLSEQALISVSFLSDIENGRSNPSLDRLREISEALGKQPSYFLDEPEVAEEGVPFGSLDDRHRRLLMSLAQQPDFIRILEAFEGFENWTEREKAELLSFLNAKRQFR